MPWVDATHPISCEEHTEMAEPTVLDKAFEALATFDWGADRVAIEPIDAAIIATHGDVSGRAALESRLLKLLSGTIPRDANDTICRMLSAIGGPASVPALAARLANKETSHMARFALERIPGPESIAALRTALESVENDLKIGLISSLGNRADPASVSLLAPLLSAPNAALAKAAAAALGLIGTSSAAAALGGAKPAETAVGFALLDARLCCAERLLKNGKRAEALAIFTTLADGTANPKPVRLAATRGKLACLDNATPAS
jgi:hypothetical protein